MVLTNSSVIPDQIFFAEAVCSVSLNCFLRPSIFVERSRSPAMVWGSLFEKKKKKISTTPSSFASAFFYIQESPSMFWGPAIADFIGLLYFSGFPSGLKAHVLISHDFLSQSKFVPLPRDQAAMCSRPASKHQNRRVYIAYEVRISCKPLQESCLCANIWWICCEYSANCIVHSNCSLYIHFMSWIPSKQSWSDKKKWSLNVCSLSYNRCIFAAKTLNFFQAH